MKNIRKTAAAAAGLLAAAFFYFRSGQMPPAEDAFLLTESGTQSPEASGELPRDAGESERTEPAVPSAEGFTELQKSELEELISRCLEQQLKERVEEAVTGALKENLQAMTEDGRLAGAMGKYFEVQSTLVNINTADIPELTRLYGIGETKARAILEYRKEHGAFSSVDELANVSGISPATVEKLRAQATL